MPILPLPAILQMLIGLIANIDIFHETPVRQSSVVSTSLAARRKSRLFRGLGSSSSVGSISLTARRESRLFSFEDSFFSKATLNDLGDLRRSRASNVAALASATAFFRLSGESVLLNKVLLFSLSICANTFTNEVGDFKRSSAAFWVARLSRPLARYKRRSAATRF